MEYLKNHHEKKTIQISKIFFFDKFLNFMLNDIKRDLFNIMTLSMSGKISVKDT